MGRAFNQPLADVVDSLERRERILRQSGLRSRRACSVGAAFLRGFTREGQDTD
jgi:hypothetical protein